MEIHDIPSTSSHLLVALNDRRERQRLIMIRRRLVPWRVRRDEPERAKQIFQSYDTAFKQMVSNYVRGAP